MTARALALSKASRRFLGPVLVVVRSFWQDFCQNVRYRFRLYPLSPSCTDKIMTLTFWRSSPFPGTFPGPAELPFMKLPRRCKTAPLAAAVMLVLAAPLAAQPTLDQPEKVQPAAAAADKAAGQAEAASGQKASAEQGAAAEQKAAAGQGAAAG